MISNENRSDEAYRNAIKLEEIRFLQLISEAARKREEDITAMQRSKAARGLGISGARFKNEVDILFGSIEGVIKAAINNRKDFGKTVPQMLSGPSIEQFGETLSQHVDSAIAGFRARQAPQIPHGAAAALAERGESRARSLKAKIAQEMAALVLEAGLGLHKREDTHTTTLNISNSTIANLNLGSVIGNIINSIHQLNTAGRSDVASSVQALAEESSTSVDLSDETRKEMLEHLAVVTEQAAQPAEKRKLAPLKSSLRAIKSFATTGTQLLTLYQAVEHALRISGIVT